MIILNEYLLAAIASLLVIFYIWENLKVKRSPPGPKGLPIFGNILQIGMKPHAKFSEWSKKHGPIFKIKMGNLNAVVLSDHKLVKELLSDNVSTGRMTDNPLLHEFAKGPNGVVTSQGPNWEQQRRFTLRTLKNFGFAKTSMETLILDEAGSILEWFQTFNGKPVLGNRLFNAPVVNSLWRIVTGERCDWEKTQSYELDSACKFFNSVNEITTNGLVFAPVLRFIAPKYFGWNRYLNCVNDMFGLFDESIKKHKETFDPNNLRDFIDHYLMEINTTTDPDSSFYKEIGEINLVTGVFGLFLAGSETTANTLAWTMLYLSHYQAVQKKMQAEIDQVLGSEIPSLSKRHEMPFTEAVILEVLRISTVVPWGIPHTLLANVNFHGYNLPKGTSIFVNHYGIHHDPAVWGDPETFRPNRFLNEDETSCVRYEALLPFSEGRRKCIGETLAKDTLFIFLVSIFQKFDVHLCDIDSLPDFEPEIGCLLAAKPFKIVILPRER